uniref:Ciliary microtubule inner protein 2A n=1 Tax=Crocodylus porosus TaxID=8502 RepID=A0A7M4FB52_CROPO
RYQIGETYGKTTSHLLTDPSIQKSPCSVLAPLMKPKFLNDFSDTKHPLNQMLDRDKSYIPGYTGKIQVPLKAHTRAPTWYSRQAETASAPLPDTAFPVPPLCPRQAPSLPAGRMLGEAASAPGGSAWLSPGSLGLHLPPVPMTEAVDVSRYSQLPQLDVPNLIQRKAISGYTGFIPRFTWVMGVNYLKGVEEAMNEFDINQHMARNPMCTSNKRQPQTYWPNKRIYTSTGLIPFYTGFVPSKNNYMLTFGNSSRKAYHKQKQQARAF